jgi:hypothetical protein
MKINRVFWDLICDGIAIQVSFGDIGRLSNEYLCHGSSEWGFVFTLVGLGLLLG